MRITARKGLSSTQRELVEEVCEQRGVDCEIVDQGAWMLVKMTGEVDAISAAWAHIRAGRNEHGG